MNVKCPSADRTARPRRATLSPSISPIAADIGVQLDGVDLDADPDTGNATRLDDDIVGLLRTAVAEHHVVVLRDQFLSADRHTAVAESFGTILASPVQIAIGAASATDGAVSTIEDTAERPPAGFTWHTDLSWTARPPQLGFLSAVTIPARGGDTIWANTAALFDALSASEQERCERSTVVHRPDDSLLASVARHHGSGVADRLRRGHAGQEHPLVGVDVITGRRHLFLSPLYGRCIVGPAGDDALLDRLHSMLDNPHHQVRWRWREGDFVIWNEASTCHRALTDHYPQRRVMRRCVTARSCAA